VELLRRFQELSRYQQDVEGMRHVPQLYHGYRDMVSEGVLTKLSFAYLFVDHKKAMQFGKMWDFFRI
jgi:hypothetical protein